MILLSDSYRYFRGKWYGNPVTDALLAHISPMGWSHIGLTGDYLWEQADQVASDSYRALNDPGARLRSVA
ncbi:MAG: Tn3 family transposase [Parvibaculum sp.]